MGEGTSLIAFRRATAADAQAMALSRSADPDWGPADPRTELYLRGIHHPQRALPPRTACIAVQDEEVVGYIAGHLTERYDCEGELQYIWVAVKHRRSGIASRLLRMLAEWFCEQGARRICVDVEPENAGARSFYISHGARELNPHWLVWRDISTCLCEG
jgi:ribosomal protein S18 acetylase RimI-like enzyme